MKELATAFVILLAATPVKAGGWDFYDGYGDYSDHRGCCIDTYAYDVGTVYAPRDYAPRVYVPYGYVYSAEPDVYGADCIVTRKYRHGYVNEKIECDDDDD
jgi:hypothetical protein